jgi:DNA-binding response OmpR family regulator
VRFVTVAELRQGDFEVQEATEGRGALQRVADSGAPPDLVVLDVTLPDLVVLDVTLPDLVVLDVTLPDLDGFAR